MVHGEMDDNSGTFPIQSERLYHAIKGRGGTVHYVVLPYEAHGYRGRENLLHLLYEENAWLEKYVKNAAPAGAGAERQKASQAGKSCYSSRERCRTAKKHESGWQNNYL